MTTYVVFEQVLTRNGARWRGIGRGLALAEAKRYAGQCNRDSRNAGYAARFWYCTEGAYGERRARGVAEDAFAT